MAALLGGEVVAGPDDVVKFARARGVPVKLFTDLGSVRTVFEAAQRMDREPAQIGNIVLVTVRGEALLVIVPGDRRVDGNRLCRALGAKPTEVALATQEEVKRLTGYASGTIPPFGHTTALPVLLDEALLRTPTTLLPAGAPDALIEVDVKALAKLPNVRRGEWSVPMDPDGGSGAASAPA